jgi:hypothetical protein
MSAALTARRAVSSATACSPTAMPSARALASAMPASDAWYAASTAACCDGASLSSTVRFAAATAASTDAPGAAFSVGTTAFGYWRVIALTASKTAV